MSPLREAGDVAARHDRKFDGCSWHGLTWADAESFQSTGHGVTGEGPTTVLSRPWVWASGGSPATPLAMTAGRQEQPEWELAGASMGSATRRGLATGGEGRTRLACRERRQGCCGGRISATDLRSPPPASPMTRGGARPTPRHAPPAARPRSPSPPRPPAVRSRSAAEETCGRASGKRRR